ncbi:SDR family NAD(P)-dependent oxidoreductase [Microbacter margulisiae]|uniref:NAD(P)-dependent dehydrogenase (Short-subunit alcohol dehydrogenase family) n=1 Tax=Microbacter margulisiae TaxID=1350067 RepID=A0A7W5DNM2_9PORP|nr:SDR family NAD(P)-dependent oxidoreductase [Microbacter margulisiae]MBB3186252.1 NAD(P)-dependent dehydrogenase (short-subunit alcohol dehydrogenase family) [Microbacter margulisiae]
MKTSFQQTILVTGTSSGIGRAVAVHLAREGYTVLASVRNSHDAEALQQLGITRLIPLHPLDLTLPEQIKTITGEIKTRVEQKVIPPLYAVIHIAGGGQIAPIELMDINGFRNELETRLVGPVSLLQKLLPLLRQTRGKVLWIATPGLLPVPYVADIHAPDFAVNYLARTLNIELQPDGIKNILVRCGGIDTPSPERSETHLNNMLKRWPDERLRIYKARLINLQNGLKSFNSRRTAPEEVASTVMHILKAKHPRGRYPVGYMSKAGALFEMLPQSWVDAIFSLRERKGSAR